MSTGSGNDSGSLVVGMLGVLFVGLKLTGFIDWSWWWVTAPFWGGLVVAVVVLAVVLPLVIRMGNTGR